MIGVGVWYSNKLTTSRKNLLSKEKTLKKVKSDEALNKETYNDYYAT